MSVVSVQDFRVHVRTHEMWAGVKDFSTKTCHLYDPKTAHFVTERVEHSPMLMKVIDEIIVNALDHAIKHREVTRIDVAIDDNGVISVYNDGPGFSTSMVQLPDGRSIHNPTAAFTEAFASTNFNENRTVGGQNGLGAKITVAVSELFTIDTVDVVESIRFRQSYYCDPVVIAEPILEPYNSAPFTRITFTPDMAFFKYGLEYIPTLRCLIEMRTWFIAAYAMVTRPKVTISFCNNVMRPQSFVSFCHMFTPDVCALKMKQMTSVKVNKKLCATCVSSTERKTAYVWNVGIALSDSPRQVSVINGIHVKDGGTHIKYLQMQILSKLDTKIKTLCKRIGVQFKPSYVTNKLFIFVCGPVEDPKFNSQTKERLDNTPCCFRRYVFTAAHVREIWALIEPMLTADLAAKPIMQKRVQRSRGRIDLPKYKSATQAGTRSSKACCLIITEGDSANTMVTTALNSGCNPLFNYGIYGTFSIQGVPPNGLKESKSANGKSTKVLQNVNADGSLGSWLSAIPPALDQRRPSEKLMRNARLTDLATALNLSYNCTYATNTKQGNAEWAKLRYGAIIGLTDQDLDGYNIFGLICTFIVTYWPALLDRGFIRRINTPIIRTYPKQRSSRLRIKEFFTEHEFNQWRISYERGTKRICNSFKIKYYKGLAKHSKKEIVHMFRNTPDNITVYYKDDDAILYMCAYYGPNTDVRKELLSVPLDGHIPIDRRMPLSIQFTHNTKAYQLDNCVRKLASVADGFIAGRRKIFFAVRERIRKSTVVASAAGIVLAHANYHHGPTSLENSMIYMAQAYLGARVLPLLLPIGIFGTRDEGFSNYPASRYVNTMLNADLADALFRPEDDYVLPYTQVDGNYCEPDYYMPILPYLLCETMQLAATGWKMRTYARELSVLFDNIREMIADDGLACSYLPPNVQHMNGSNPHRVHNNKEYIVGSYAWDAPSCTLTITSLPPSKCAHDYVHGGGNGMKEDARKKRRETITALCKAFENGERCRGFSACGAKSVGMQYHPRVANASYRMDDEHAIVELVLDRGTFEVIIAPDSGFGTAYLDPIEDYFGLSESINHNLNFMGVNGSVVMLKDYGDAFELWFDLRKALYAKRVERERLLYTLRLELLRFMQRFAAEHNRYQISSRTSIDDFTAILKTSGYMPFNKEKLMSPKHILVSELRNAILGDTATYNYIFDMAYRNLGKAGCDRRATQIQALEAALAALVDKNEPFIGAAIWLRELKQLETVIVDGHDRQWKRPDDYARFESE